MKTKLTVLGFGLFVLSFLLPAYRLDILGDVSELNGFACAHYCSIGLWSAMGMSWDSLGWIAYFFSFTFSNLAMVIMSILLITKFRRTPVPKPVIALQIVLLLHVLSWLHLDGYNLSWEYAGGIEDILIGYYVWLLSMVLILCAAILTRRSIQPVSQP